jgi:hypothetical protein
MVFPGGDVPEELVIDFDTMQAGSKSGSGEGELETARSGKVTFRLQPSSLTEAELIYVEVFDE